MKTTSTPDLPDASALLDATQEPSGPVQIRFAELREAVGKSFGPSVPVSIDQAQIDTFAKATEDHQWLHVDPEKAAKGPFGTTIAHGYLTLSLFSNMLWSLIEVPDATGIVNYGLEKVRFPAPVPVDSDVSLTVTVARVDDVPGGLQLTFDAVFSLPGRGKPVCVAQIVFRYYN